VRAAARGGSVRTRTCSGTPLVHLASNGVVRGDLFLALGRLVVCFLSLLGFWPFVRIQDSCLINISS
jgi:hypothetical protein